MPVSGEYTWSESDGCIEIAIPLKGVSAKNLLNADMVGIEDVEDLWRDLDAALRAAVR